LVLIRFKSLNANSGADSVVECKEKIGQELGAVGYDLVAHLFLDDSNPFSSDFIAGFSSKYILKSDCSRSPVAPATR
jgi:hypothetical protein